MSSSVSAMRAADPPVRREETLAVALLLAFAGGYLDTYTWTTHGVLANAQTANLVFLWVHATAAQWQQAFHFVPPLFAFFVGVVIAAWLRRAAGDRTGRISLIVEIGVLILVGILHNRVPQIAGTLGISMVAAMQTSLFTRVEGATYSSVMITGNFRQAIEGGVCPGQGRSAGRAAAKILHLHGRVRRLRDRRRRRSVPHRADSSGHIGHSRRRAADGPAALRDVACAGRVAEVTGGTA